MILPGGTLVALVESVAPLFGATPALAGSLGVIEEIEGESWVRLRSLHHEWASPLTDLTCVVIGQGYADGTDDRDTCVRAWAA